MLDKKAKGYVAVLDIGSNAVRLVVYDGFNRAPVKIHNERNLCSLGSDLSTTGRLNPEGVEKALDSIGRFSGLLDAMKIKTVKAVATAALRDAEDGPDFIARVEKDFGLKIHIVEGNEEARLSAQGVMMNGLGADGIIGDYGGGSLELIAVEKGVVKGKASLPLGSHRMLAIKTRDLRIKHADELLETISFLKKYKGGDFYALGGAWRSMARAHMHMAKHPLHVLDHYTIDAKRAVEFSGLISKQSPISLERTVGFSKKRVKDMAVAALVLERLFDKIRPSRIVFSGTGLREGLLFDGLPPAVRRQDALVASCAKIAVKISRFDDLKGFDTLFRWMEPLFAGQGDGFSRLLQSSCLLSDAGWFEHEDYKAENAFQRLLVLPYYGVDHGGRAFLALSQYVRYAGDDLPDVTKPAQKILGAEGIEAAVVTGLAQRMAYLLTGGALSLLSHCKLKVTPKNVILKLDRSANVLNAEVVGEALEDLARAMKREAVVES